ncbi:MAG: hypothetical protein RBS72_06245 [Sedimentisphaerales bacterium]|jgi:hypothetical protein|nr:hypothetical protein [Sedimentisphaerales bacterium]NLZ04762.1 hypothetical protein [Phycisphaerae bacterium]HNY79927.1 hypothetical protein [Sedimentisphaerales bacterium]HOC65026.1 hypothetical protein [Sedimentisphaerales bacterium]HOH63265.1 hypothetical protein [Sedimentisphaerales bacterium]
MGTSLGRTAGGGDQNNVFRRCCPINATPIALSNTAPGEEKIMALAPDIVCRPEPD